MIVVNKNLIDESMVDYRTDIIYYPYFLLFKIRKLDLWSKKLRRKTQVVNIYNNWVEGGCIWDGDIWHIRKALDDINLEQIIWDRVLIAGDINTHSPIWNLHCFKGLNIFIVKEVKNKFSQLINNELGRPTYFTSQGISVINLAFSIAELSPLTWGRFRKIILHCRTMNLYYYV